MRKRQMAVCDREPEYTRRFTEYANQRREPLFVVHGFTDYQALSDFAEENKVDVALVSPEFYQGDVKNGKLGQVVFLTDAEYLDAEPACPVLYKFQSCELILRQILDLYAEQVPAGFGQALRLQDMKLIGIYSPVGRTGKTGFALALGRELAKQRRTLYLNMEEYSGFHILYPYGDGWTLSELMYFLKQGKSAFACKLEGMIQQIGGLDYIPPLKSPVELRHISIKDWLSLLEALGQGTSYEAVILDLGGAVDGLFELLERCDGIYTPVEEDETARAKLMQYEETLRLLDLEDVLQKTKKLVLLPGGELEKLAKEEGRLWGSQ